MRHSAVAGVLLLVVGIGLTACKPTDPPKADKHSVAQWLHEEDNGDCTRASADAIIKSGLPYPNRQFEAYVDEQGRQQKRVISRDMWLGPDRFVIPGELLGSNPTWPEYHPRRYLRLAGTLPHFYPRGPSAGVVDGMAAMVDVNFQCSTDPTYLATWGTSGYRSNEEAIEKVRGEYLKSATILPNRPGEVALSKREDLGMWELLLDFKDEAHGQRGWRATYWPLDRELEGPDGAVSSIRCAIRHDPEMKRYGGVGWICSSGFRLTPHANVRVDIYVSHLQHMPTVFDQVQQLLINAKQPKE